MFNNLRELILSMPTEEMCREYLVQQRWNGKPQCPYCGCGKTYSIEGGKRFKCGNAKCYKKFSVTVGTVFEASKIPLVKWFTAVYLCSAHKKGISSYQLGKDIGVSQKCSWFMLHRIREMMRVKDDVKLDNIVEVDETFVGGIVANMSKSKRAKLRTDNGGTIQNKTMVVGMLERGGNLKLVALGKETGCGILQPLVKKNIDTDAVLITDTSNNYDGLVRDYAGHEVVNHSNQEYVRDKVIHTNSIEGVFSLLKRSIIGIYHQVTPKHLSRYCDETMYRYNTRKMNDAARFTISLQNVDGRLKWKDLVFNTEKVENENVLPIADHSVRKILQIESGIVINQFDSIKDAERATGIPWNGIYKCLRGKRRTSKGYTWKYA